MEEIEFMVAEMYLLEGWIVPDEWLVYFPSKFSVRYH